MTSKVAAEDTQRLDKWLWAARLFKTRALAAEAIHGGKVSVNDATAKPARMLKRGDALSVVLADGVRDISVLGFNAQRRPAAEARLLYVESEKSIAAREAAAELRKLAPAPGADRHGRPTKRDRRQIHRFTE
jgi:ribosome-associated heat shock protein Hsp15